jgi:hypothetical protein
MLKALSDREAADSVPKSAGPEFHSFARVEDAGCLRNWWGNNLSPDNAQHLPTRATRPVGVEAGLRASLMTCYPAHDRNADP